MSFKIKRSTLDVVGATADGAITESKLASALTSTSFPTSLDSSTLSSIEALQAKVGVNSSAVTTSLDYKITQLEADAVISDQINEIVKLTQAAYNALTPDANTLYVIVG